MRDYELVVLLHPDLEIDLDKPLKKVEKIITDNGGKIVDKDNWGKRKLAYPIKREDYAIYVLYNVQLPGESVSKVEGILNITKEVVRYLIAHPVPKAEETEEDKKDSKEEKKEEANNEGEE